MHGIAEFVRGSADLPASLIRETRLIYPRDREEPLSAWAEELARRRRTFGEGCSKTDMNNSRQGTLTIFRLTGADALRYGPERNAKVYAAGLGC